MIHGLNNRYLYTAKKIIVRITDGSHFLAMQGTGFFVKKNDNLVFVTNRHMIEPGYANPHLKGYYVQQLFIESYMSFDEDDRPKGFNAGEVLNNKEFVVADNPVDDVACLIDAKLRPPGITINAYIEYDMLANKDWFDNKITVCDSIAYPGFPEWFDRKNNTPIFRMGTIASDPRLDYAYDLSEKMGGAARVAYEGFSSGGASGSPVFSMQKGFPIGNGIKAPDDFYREVKVIGINAGHFEAKDIADAENVDDNLAMTPDNNEGHKCDVNDAIKSSGISHSGISFFYKSTVIKDIIDKTF